MFREFSNIYGDFYLNIVLKYNIHMKIQFIVSPFQMTQGPFVHNIVASLANKPPCQEQQPTK